MNQASTRILDEATLVARVWMHANRHFEPDDIIVECVPGLHLDGFSGILNRVDPDMDLKDLKHERAPSRVMQDLDGEASTEIEDSDDNAERQVGYDLFEMRFSPVDLGIPVARNRVYGWFRNRTSVRLVDNISNNNNGRGLHELFQEVFYKKMNTDASIYMASDKELHRAHKVGWNREHGHRAMIVPGDTPEDIDRKLRDQGPFLQSDSQVARHLIQEEGEYSA